MPHDSTNQPPLLANRYRAVEPVGKGAHATTWRGWDDKLDRAVAIKILHRQLSSDPVFVQRFRDEARVAASVRQANVVDVYDFGQEGDILYIVMQFIDGQDLKTLIQQRAPIDAREIRRIIGNVLDGLHAIHAAGIVHRDIKPQNILIGRDGLARVTDFGVAEVGSSAGLTGDGLTIGTVDYMAPEQAQGRPLTQSADLYATGVVLYEMLTGTLPFQGSAREIMLQHINTVATAPSVRMPQRGITPAMDAVVAQSLAKDPQRRFGSARAMKNAVGSAFAPGNGTTATTALPFVPPTPPPTAQSWQPARADVSDAGSGLNGAFKGLIVVLVLGALGVILWGAVEIMGSDIRFPWADSGGNNGIVTTTPADEPTLAPTNEPVTEGVIEPMETPAPTPTNPPPTEAPTIAPTEEPTQPPPTATSVPVTATPTEQVPIEPIEPDTATETPAIEPAN